MIACEYSNAWSTSCDCGWLSLGAPIGSDRESFSIFRNDQALRQMPSPRSISFCWICSVSDVFMVLDGLFIFIFIFSVISAHDDKCAPFFYDS